MNISIETLLVHKKEEMMCSHRPFGLKAAMTAYTKLAIKSFLGLKERKNFQVHLKRFIFVLAMILC